jgi:hypothetical protein
MFLQGDFRFYTVKQMIGQFRLTYVIIFLENCDARISNRYFLFTPIHHDISLGITVFKHFQNIL